MANRTGGRSATKSKIKGNRAATKGRPKAAGNAANQENQPESNREVVYQKLEELATPILEKYGVPAFDELIHRMEETIKDFNDEVTTLFDEMVNQSREEQARLKSLLTESEDTEQEEEESDKEEGMSDFEKRLERGEKSKQEEQDTTESS